MPEEKGNERSVRLSNPIPSCAINSLAVHLSRKSPRLAQQDYRNIVVMFHRKIATLHTREILLQDCCKIHIHTSIWRYFQYFWNISITLFKLYCKFMSTQCFYKIALQSMYNIATLLQYRATSFCAVWVTLLNVFVLPIPVIKCIILNRVLLFHHFTISLTQFSARHHFIRDLCIESQDNWINKRLSINRTIFIFCLASSFAHSDDYWQVLT